MFKWLIFRCYVSLPEGITAAWRIIPLSKWLGSPPFISHEWPFVRGTTLLRALNNHGQINHLSNEKNLGWLGYIGDEILPSYIGHYFINHEIRIPSLTIQDSIESKAGFFSWLNWVPSLKLTAKAPENRSLKKEIPIGNHPF